MMKLPLFAEDVAQSQACLGVRERFSGELRHHELGGVEYVLGVIIEHGFERIGVLRQVVPQLSGGDHARIEALQM